MSTYTILSKIIKPFVGTGIGNIPLMMGLYQYVIPKILPKNNTTINVQGFDIEIMINKHIGDIATELLFKGIHEPATTKVFKKIVRFGDTVIDVGANIGYFTLLSSKLVGWKGEVYAFEPDIGNMTALISNIELNKFENIKPYKTAIGNQTGNIAFYTSSKESARHSLIKTREHDGEGTVYIDKIDNIMAGISNIKLLKTDTEGNELAVLQGAEQTILRSNNITLIVEINFEALEACNTKIATLWNYIVSDLGMKYIYLVNDYNDSIEPLDCLNSLLQVAWFRKKKDLGYNLLCSRKEIEL